VKKQPGSKKGNADAQFVEEIAQARKVAVKERLSAGENYITHAEGDHRSAVAFEVRNREFTTFGTLPNIAHDAAAIAQCVNVEK
jgi:hypothetical protein